MIAYKLFRIMKDGSLASLFINKKARYIKGEWMEAEFHPTNGYSQRFGWHCTHAPSAPHLSMEGRKWFEVEIKEYETIERPRCQGGLWYLAKHIKINKQL